MPELPEVETVRRGLLPHISGQRISGVVVRNGRLRWPVPADLPQWLTGRRFTGAARRGKYLLLALETPSTLSPPQRPDQLLVHLGMSGRVWVLPASTPVIKHDHIDILLGPQLLRYHDPRRFGAVLPWPASAPQHPLMQTLGPEPFDPAFNGDYLYQRARGKTIACKAFIMDGGVVVGAGNIYAAESLFRSGIRPTRPAGELTLAECHSLAQHIRAVLLAACELGGTTLKDFAGANGESGYFQQDLYVYGRAGQPCRVCASPITAARLAGRQSNYCPSCQR